MVGNIAKTKETQMKMTKIMRSAIFKGWSSFQKKEF